MTSHKTVTKIRLRGPGGLLDIHDWWTQSSHTLLYFSVAWPIMMEGLEMVAMYLTPIYPHPLLRDMHLDLWNPWRTTCPGLGPATTDFSHEYCYGTNMAHPGGPYSLLWYWIMYGLAGGGIYYPYWSVMTIFIPANFLLTWRIRRAYPGYGFLSLVNTFYAWTGFLFLIAWPQILLTFYFSTLAMLGWQRLRGVPSILLLIIAPLLRFPIGGPSYLWAFIIHYSFPNPGNWLAYALTITWYLLVIVRGGLGLGSGCSPLDYEIVGTQPSQ